MGLKLNLPIAVLVGACVLTAGANAFETRYNPPISILQTVKSSQQLILEKHWWHGAPLVVESFFGATNIGNLGTFVNGGLEFESSMLYAANIGALDTANAPLDYLGAKLSSDTVLSTYEMQITCPHDESGMCDLLLAYDPAASKPVNTVLVKTGPANFVLIDASKLDQLVRN